MAHFPFLFFFFALLVSASDDPLPPLTSNWAVLLNTSRYWFNYRHASNIFTLYNILKSLGFPDSQIIVLSADDFACNARNWYRGALFNQILDDNPLRDNLYSKADPEGNRSCGVDLDYRGMEVTVEGFIRLLTGTDI